MRFRRFGSEFDSFFSDACSFIPALNSQIEARNLQQSFRVGTELCFNCGSRFEGCFTLAAEVKIRGNLCDYAAEKFVGDTNVGLINCQHELFDSIIDVTTFQKLITKSSMCAEEQLGSPRARFGLGMGCEKRLQLFRALRQR